MIHLDTNILIRAACGQAGIVGILEHWWESGESVRASAVAWFEFACGPVDADRKRMIWRLIRDHFVSFDAAESERAAELFNLAGRGRAQRWDCMIAATAIETNAQLATLNSTDFRVFVPAGLALAELNVAGGS